MNAIHFIDSHCHLDRLDLKNHDAHLAHALSAARAKGVQGFLCVSIDLEHFPVLLQIAHAHQKVAITVGVHPTETPQHEPTVAQLLALGADACVKGVGETGLDFYRDSLPQDVQMARFHTHIAAAKLLKKPLIIHTRSAPSETIAIMKAEGADRVQGVMHCFTENWEVAKAALDLGFYISFSGIITFKNAASIREVAKRVPLDAILIETDAPYLAPVPFRGKPNEPAYVYYVAEKLAEIKGVSLETIAAHTTRNFIRLFGDFD